MSRDIVHILYIEDDEDDLLLIREHLDGIEGQSYKVDWRSDLQSAYDALQAQAYDVCLLDFRLGGHTGLDLLQMLSENSCISNTPIILLTGLGDRSIDIQAMKMGAVDYLEKNTITPLVLERAIRYAVERHATLNTLARKNHELGILNAMKNEFVGMAAHDLRNPLSVVRLVSELLLDGDAGELNEEQMGMISQTNRLSEFMLKLVNDMLDLSQIESGNLALHFERTDLEELIRNNLALHSRVAERKHIELIFDPVDTIPVLQLDADKVEQVLNNLVGNAISYSPARTRVWISVAVEDRDAVISVVDEGPGIPEAERGNLFQPFETTSVKSSSGERSTGLGLAIARKIVSGHSGRIWFDSELGKGTTFYVALPLESASV